MSLDSFDPRFDNGTPSPPLSPFYRQEQIIDGEDGRDFDGIRESSHSVNSSIFECDSSSEDDGGMNAFGGLGGSWDSDQNFDTIGLNCGDSGGHVAASVSLAGFREWAPPINAAESSSIGNEGISMTSIEVSEMEMFELKSQIFFESLHLLLWRQNRILSGKNGLMLCCHLSIEKFYFIDSMPTDVLFFLWFLPLRTTDYSGARRSPDSSEQS